MRYQRGSCVIFEREIIKREYIMLVKKVCSDSLLAKHVSNFYNDRVMIKRLF